MDDKVGSTLPTPDEIEQAIAALNKARTLLRPYLITLSSEERRRLTRFRPGGEMVVEKVGVLASERNISLPGASVDAMRNDLELAHRLARVASTLADLERRIADTIAEAKAECWWAVTALYSALARTQRADRALEAGLRPVVDFFATGPRKRRGAPESGPGHPTGGPGDPQTPLSSAGSGRGTVPMATVAPAPIATVAPAPTARSSPSPSRSTAGPSSGRRRSGSAASDYADGARPRASLTRSRSGRRGPRSTAGLSRRRASGLSSARATACSKAPLRSRSCLKRNGPSRFCCITSRISSRFWH